MYVYNLEESEPDSMLSSSSSWCQRGRAAVLQPVTEQGVLDGGLRRAQWVLCTWAEEDVLRPGCVYVVKSFREEVVDTRQAEFPTNTTLHLCLRVITTAIYITSQFILFIYRPAHSLSFSLFVILNVNLKHFKKRLLIV